MEEKLRNQYEYMSAKVRRMIKLELAKHEYLEDEIDNALSLSREYLRAPDDLLVAILFVFYGSFRLV